MKRLIITLLTLSVLILAQDFEYVGTARCKMCHNKEEKGAQFSKWEASRHAKAFETLKSEQAAQIAADKGIEGNAWKAPECLKCHTTGFGAGGYEVMGDDFWNPADDDKVGRKAVKRMNGLQVVGCEACHGAGSAYKSSKTMKAIYSGEVDDTTVGLAQISEETCKTCHNEESPTFKPFNYEEMLQKIAHPRPTN
jgi:hypothetical protein